MLSGRYKISTIWLYSKNPKRAGHFYKDILGMKQIPHGDTFSFDGGGVRLSIHPLGEDKKQVPTGECFVVFYVPQKIESVYEELRVRGLRFEGPLEESSFGKIASFRDPDGHELYIWQPPSKRRLGDERGIVDHIEGVVRRLGS